ncbi:MAG: CDP-alcohol phosphatidyltransferase family protein [Thermodesulfobacteriota bacterium]
MKKRKFRGEIDRRVAPFLPGLITTAGLCFGLLSIGVSFRIAAGVEYPSELAWRGAVFIGIAMVLDMLDGRVARAFGIDNRFGVIYDSLSDTVCFGVAPAALVFSLFGGLASPVLNIGLMIYTVCVALRLARFNIQSASKEKRSFMGLPSPMAAGFLVSPIFVASALGAVPFPDEMALFYAVAAPVAGFFMVSAIRYRKVGFFSLGRFSGGKRFDFLATSSVLIVVVAINPGLSLAVVSVLYFLSGPLFQVLKPLRSGGEAVLETGNEQGGDSAVSEDETGGGV